MTTIAYRDGVMAADSLVTAGDWIMPYRARKIVRIRGGALLGFSGNVYQEQAFRAWIEAPETHERPDLADESKVIVVDLDGAVTLYQYRGNASFAGPFFAIGCGCIPALAAMHMGASAQRAVEIAALLDNATGGEIQVERLR